MKKCPRSLRLLLACLFVMSCARKEDAAQTVTFVRPVLYEPAVLQQSSAFSDSAYALMNQGKNAEAIAVFRQVVALTPTSCWGHYNLACAHVRAGQLEQAFQELDQVLQSGWDDAQHLKDDPDLAPCRTDARFPKLIQEATANGAEHLAYLAHGLPAATEVRSFANADSISAWERTEMDRLYSNWPLLVRWQRVGMELDIAARKIAAQRTLNLPDSVFHESSSRLGAMATVCDLEEPWGPVADGVIREAQACLKEQPSDSRRAWACYWAGVASYCRANPKPGDPGRDRAVKAAREWFARIPAASPCNGGAAAWNLKFDLAAAGENKASLTPRLVEFATKFRQDDLARAICGTFFFEDLIRALWPISLTATDLDGQPVSLDQYRGKVLLLDFWATWCGPCRRELPRVQAAYEKYHARGLEILSVSLDYGKRTTPAEYRKWIETNHMPWRHIYDQQSWNGPLVNAYHIYSIPAPFLIGKDGMLVAMGEKCRGDELEKSIQQAL